MCSYPARGKCWTVLHRGKVLVILYVVSHQRFRLSVSGHWLSINKLFGVFYTITSTYPDNRHLKKRCSDAKGGLCLSKVTYFSQFFSHWMSKNKIFVMFYTMIHNYPHIRYQDSYMTHSAYLLNIYQTVNIYYLVYRHRISSPGYWIPHGIGILLIYSTLLY